MDKITIVVPTFNEGSNIKNLLDQIHSVCENNFNCEVIVVDDGSDETALMAEILGARVICGKHQGLGQAIIDGIFAASNEVVVVMDADLSHDPKYIPDLVKALEYCGMSIGSRYTKDGCVEGWSLKRRIISRCACLLALPVTSVKDSTSGFFALKKSILKGVDIKADSWKIMLEIIVKTNSKYKEIPIIFKDRKNGESKFNKKQVLAYLCHLRNLIWFKYFRVRC